MEYLDFEPNKRTRRAVRQMSYRSRIVDVTNTCKQINKKLEETKKTNIYKT
jgi:hypothetical protein